MSIDHHKKSFDDGTLTKLEIFEAYAKSWLSIFAVTKGMPVKDLWIWDFFAGPGESIEGQPGSPIRILKIIEDQADRLIANQRIIHVRFNEKDKEKYKKLLLNAKAYIQSSGSLQRLKANGNFDGICINKDFADIFKEIVPALGSAPSLMFFDQNGVKFIGDEYLLPLLRSRRTDFLFFVSTSYFARFSSRPAFIKNVPFEWNPENPYKLIHRDIIEYVRGKIPARSKMRVYPFSIKKGSNIYGLIFGASHVLAAEKFLEIAWKKNEINGEANFDIDEDNKKKQGCLFDEFVRPTKIEKFHEEVGEAVKRGIIKNNHEAFYFAINNGFLPSEIALALKDLKRNGVIDYDGKSPRVTYMDAVKSISSNGLHIYRLK